MSIRIPIISDFDEKGVKRAVAQFKRLETAGEKTGFALKKAGVLAAAGVASLAVGLYKAGQMAWDFAKAAMADEESQRQLARALRVSAHATDAQVKSTEKWITKTQFALGVADDKLRPALARLVRSTGSLSKGQKILNVALDISAATGKDLETVVNSLGRAMDSKHLKTIRLADGHDKLGHAVKRTGQVMVENNGVLTRLGLGFNKAQLSAMSFDEVIGALQNKFGGSAQARADTFAGKMESLKQQFNEMKETLGKYVLVFLGRMADFGTQLATVYGEKGLAGALTLLNDQFQRMVFYNKNGSMNALGRTVLGFQRLYNVLIRSGGIVAGAAVAGLGSQLPIPGLRQAGEKAFVRSAFGDHPSTLRVLRERAPGFITKSPLPSSASGINGPFNPSYFNVNFYGTVTDPVATGREIDRVLKAYHRRTGQRGPVGLGNR